MCCWSGDTTTAGSVHCCSFVLYSSVVLHTNEGGDIKLFTQVSDLCIAVTYFTLNYFSIQVTFWHQVGRAAPESCGGGMRNL